MTTRLLITDADGNPISTYTTLSASGAAAWLAATLAQHAGAGTEVMAFAVHPVRGGDEYETSLVQHAGRHRIELHTRPDGLREVIGVVRHSDDRGRPLAHPLALQCALSLLHAPDAVHGTRHALRVPRGRHNTAVPMRTADQIRTARRLSRAQGRAP